MPQEDNYNIELEFDKDTILTLPWDELELLFEKTWIEAKKQAINEIAELRK